MWWLLTACPKSAPAPIQSGALATSLSPEARIFYLRAVDARERGDEAELLRSAQWVLRLSRTDVWAHIRVSELLRVSEPSLSLEAARTAVALDGDLPETHLALGLAWLASDQPVQALAELSKALGARGSEQAIAEASLAIGARQLPETLAGWNPTALSEQIVWAKLAVATCDEVMLDAASARLWTRVDDPLFGAFVLGSLLEVETARCDLVDLHEWVSEHAQSVTDRQLLSAMAHVAASAGDDPLAGRLRRLALAEIPEAPSAMRAICCAEIR